MGRSAASAAREARRARSTRKLTGNVGTDTDCATGHSPLLAVSPAYEIGRIPEGGGYPVGFIELACRLMDVTDPASVLHLCSGSVSAPLSVDMRPQSAASIIGDVRWLPFRPGSIRWIMADPPYGPDYAEALWQLGKHYPTPAVLLRECAQVLEPGGQVALLHHVVPWLPPELERVATLGITTGAGYRIRALTVARKPGQTQLW